MAHPCRTHIQAALVRILGPGPIARNSEISILNWTRANVSRGDASWESAKFRTMYKFKAHSLLKEFERDATTIVPKLVVEGDRVRLSYEFVPQLVRKIQLRQLDPKRLAWYSADVLAPDGLTARAIAKNKANDLRMEQIKAEEDDYEGILQCRKCKSKKTSYYQLQTRSADEPMVRFLVFPALHNSRVFPDDLCDMQELRAQMEVLGLKYSPSVV